MFIKLEYLNYCRICTRPEDNDPFIPVFNSDSKIALKIYLVSGIQINETTENSAVVCSQCVEDLNSADELRKKCIDAEEFFKLRFLQSDIEIEPETFDMAYTDNTIETDLVEELVKPGSSKSAEFHHEIKKIKQKAQTNNLENRYRKTAGNYDCPICFKALNARTSLLSHMKIFHSEDENPVNCPICNKSFKRRLYLIAHQKMHSDSNTSQQPLGTKKCLKQTGPFKCEICDKILKNRDCLRNHMKVLHSGGANPVICPICKKLFKRKVDLVVHQKMCSPAQETSTMTESFAPVKCLLCHKTFTTKFSLTCHVKSMHTNMSEFDPNELYYCDLCSYRNIHKSNLKNHINFHHVEKDKDIVFICSTCGKKCPTRNALSLHERIHRNREVTCPVCSKVIVSKAQLSVHIRMIHERSLTIACPDCDHVASCRAALDQHRKSIHLNQKDHVCSDCGARFLTRSYLARHFRIHTGEKPYNCDFCNKDFRILGGKRKHEKICPKKPKQ